MAFTFTVRGRIFDLFGYPLEDVGVCLVTGYSLQTGSVYARSEAATEGVLAGPVKTDSGGAFQISATAQDQDIGLQATVRFSPDRLNVRQVTGTSIPFYPIELWSPDSSKWVNDLLSSGVYNDLRIYVDPSRTFLSDYFSQHHRSLYLALQDNPNARWQANHRDPDDPGDFLSDRHWGEPRILKRDRRINPPWGKERDVIPFVVGEGQVFKAIAQHEEDYDRLFRVQLEPHYWYLPNPDNELADDDHAPWLEGRKGAIEGEMCLWFMGKKLGPNSFEPPKTNVSRTDELQGFVNRAGNPRRVWLLGTWCHDTDHGEINEIHPVYWIVPFIGGWRRFWVSELFYLSSPPAARTVVETNLNQSPAELRAQLKNLYDSTFDSTAQIPDVGSPDDLYARSAVRLNQYGLNMAGAQPIHPANSLDYEGHRNWARNQSLTRLKDEIKRRLDVIYTHLTELGSGVFVFPYMVYAFEGVELIRQADKVGVTRPQLNLGLHPLMQASLAKEALGEVGPPAEATRDKLVYCYDFLFTQMAGNDAVPKEAIARFYADSTLRFVHFGIFPANDPQHSAHYNDHYNWALSRAKPYASQLKESMRVRIHALWQDLLPHTRTH